MKDSASSDPKGRRSNPRKRISSSHPEDKRDRRPSSAGSYSGSGRPPFWNKPNDPEKSNRSGAGERSSEDRKPSFRKSGPGGERPARPSFNRPSGSGAARPPRSGSRPDSPGFKRPGSSGFSPNDRSERPDHKRTEDRSTGFGKRRSDGSEFKRSGDSRPPRPSATDRQRPESSGFRRSNENRPTRPSEPGRERNSPSDRGFSSGNRDTRPKFDRASGREDSGKSFESRPRPTRSGTSDGEKPILKKETRLGKQAPSQARSVRYNREGGSPGQPPEYDWKKMQTMARRPVRRKQVTEGESNVESLMRLNRYIAHAGLCSRREADELISTGQITVNGKVMDQMGYLVKPDDVVKYGKRLLNKEKLVYILLNKPKDFLTTTEDPEERKTVMNLVAAACKERIYPVGRLDRNTTGLLLLTNDGELSEKLMHPSHKIVKIYQADLDKPLTAADEKAIRDGLTLEDGFAPVDEFEVLSKERDIVGIKIHIGRNRIVRRIFEHLGYKVMKLDRVFYAGLTKKDLPRGNWRFLSEKEVINLKYFS